MPRSLDPNQYEWETVEYPLAAGVDLRSPGRAVQAPRLKKLENGRFDSGVMGMRRRRGHLGYEVRTTASLSGTAPSGGGGGSSVIPNGGGSTINPADNWLYGYGLTDGTTATASPPDPGLLAGMATRDNEVLAWDGWRMFSWPANQESGLGWHTPAGATMPSANTQTIAKVSTAMRMVDIAMNDEIIVVVWAPDGSSDAYVSIYDRTTRTAFKPELRLSVGGAIQHVRAVPVGDWVHFFASSTAQLKGWSVHNRAPWDVKVIASTPGTCDTFFDVRRVTDDRFILVKRDTDDTARLTYYQSNGVADTTYCSQNTLLDTEPNDGGEVVHRVAIDQHPQTGELCLAWTLAAGTGGYRRVYTSNGIALGTRQALTTVTAVDNLSVTARYLTASGYGLFDIYVSDATLVGQPYVRVEQTEAAGTVDEVSKRYYSTLASHAFRVGHSTFALLKYRYGSGSNPVQQVYILSDRDLLPVGKFEYTTAPATLPANGLTSVHFESGQGSRNWLRLHGCLLRRERLDSANNDQFDEESVKLVEYNFLPRLRSAQLGRTTYFAGAQLWAYDGNELVEQGFHHTPENVSVAASVGAGNLNGTYQYRIRPAYKNAQGEEIVGPTITTSGTAIANKKGELSWESLQHTRRTGVYFLVFRRAATGTTYYLVSNRDQSVVAGDNACPVNDTSAALVTFVDNLSDANLIAKEQDRLDGGLMEPFSAPACEVIAAGRDRLWLAGGEIESGSLVPSLVYTPEARVGTAEFNTSITTVVDRGVEPITAIGFLGHSVLVFKSNRIYSFESDGPSNTLVGSFDFPRVIAADTGALHPEGVTLGPRGLFFVSPSGIQLLDINTQTVDVGAPVRDEVLVSAIVSAVLVPQDEEVRFYRTDGRALVFSYRTGEWSTWTNLEAVGAVSHPVTGLAVIGKIDGQLWVETDGVWTDHNRGYTFRLRTAPITSGGFMNFMRARTVAWTGDKHGEHTLYCKAYYDDRDFPEDEWIWAAASDLNPGTWGGGTWGSGTWGNSADASVYDAVTDSVYHGKRKLKRQKCSRVEFEINDGGTQNEGPALTALALEIGRRGGLSRIPARTFS